MYKNNQRLLILDADGTTIDAFKAIEEAFDRHGLTLGDEASFQKRHNLFKYLGGLKEFPSVLKKNIRKKNRMEIIDTLTGVYRTEARLYPGIAELIRALVAAPDVVVGLVTRNITNEPLETLRQLFVRHDLDIDALDFLVHIPLKEKKTAQFRALRERFDINPARGYICGDEHKDFHAAINTGLHPFMVSYGFEDHDRLTTKFGVPAEVISRTSEALCARVRHALDLPVSG
ncbi:HAD family hydrolase [Noviherbaspirillum sedimenti]|uniref:phosphoglycolate phosphatase n=1 Tax=Noviherbaspirillum sedimenti TaxID=2320865 RepID=A0A3A3GPN6_9BURK|nr:HAD hydrolase-like protein [Noviherbaspirillum sedimenti]RJG02950.1 HAD family hydrolase [Noviherbaspirillum sedimenti]